MIRFHPLKVKEVRRETRECVSIAFEIPDNLKDEFAYRHGQSLTLRTTINGEEIRRSYSICSSPFDGELRIAVKEVNQGIFSTYANRLIKKGEYIEVMPPVGKFYTELHETHKKNYIAFAAGSGITPVYSIIKTTLLTEPESRFTLVYGNRTRSSIIFKEELEGLKNKFLSRFRIIYVFSRENMDAPINYGRIDREKCQFLFSKLPDLKQVDECFLCGPEEMIFSVKDFLEEIGVGRKKVHFELFGASKTSLPIPRKNMAASEEKSRIVIRLDGASFEFDLARTGQSILDAALKQGADLPFACKGGVCCTCRARLTEGEVDMDLNYALEPEELEQGFILTCQSHPQTEKVVIDYDLK